MEEVWFCLLLVVGLFGMFICLWFCLVKYVWEPWHNDVLPEEEEDKDDSQDNEESNVVMQSITAPQSATYRPIEPSIHLTNRNLKVIGTNLINTFKNQRKLPGYIRRVIMKQSTQKQFAVLYLSFSKEDLLEPNFTNRSIKYKGITDNNNKSFPLDDGLSNYVTARPHRDLPIVKGHHAEELIAGKFAKLVEAYKEEIQCIVLYTWLFPCKDCAADIISKIQQVEVSTNVPIYILYSRVRGNEEKEKEDIKNNLEVNGIHIKHVFSRNI